MKVELPWYRPCVPELYSGSRGTLPREHLSITTLWKQTIQWAAVDWQPDRLVWPSVNDVNVFILKLYFYYYLAIISDSRDRCGSRLTFLLHSYTYTTYIRDLLYLTHYTVLGLWLINWIHTPIYFIGVRHCIGAPTEKDSLELKYNGVDNKIKDALPSVL